MKEIFRISIVVLLSPLYLVTILFKGMFEAIEPIAQDIGNNITRPFIEVYNSMYKFWEKVFKWK